MSVSPQPAPQAPPLSRSPQMVAANGSPPGSDSPSTAQLANMLSNTLVENETLKRELDKALLRADKAERRLAQMPNGEGSSSSSSAAAADVLEQHLARIADLENRLAESAAERGELEARIKRLQVDWVDCNRLIQDAEHAAAAARASFTNIIASRGGALQDISRNGECATLGV